MQACAAVSCSSRPVGNSIGRASMEEFADTAMAGDTVPNESAPWIWKCDWCGQQEKAPTTKEAKEHRACLWTRVTRHQHICPRCTRQVNRDARKEERTVEEGLSAMDLTRRQEQQYEILWNELLAASRVPDVASQ